MKHKCAHFASSDVDSAMSLLTACTVSSYPQLLERIRAAAVRVSGGNMAELHRALELAVTDWRDLLVEAGFADDTTAHTRWVPRRNSPLRLLFVCSRNQWRSPTAEKLWRADPRVEVRSAGTSPAAKRQLRIADLEWADIVFAMEATHSRRIRQLAGSLKPNVVVLDIPDDYRFMDPELVEMLRTSVEPVVARAL